VAGEALAELGYETGDLGPLRGRDRVRLIGMEVKYATVEVVRRLLRMMGIFHPAALLSRRSRRRRPGRAK
jgi:hypothetical protein